jgi:hypothetical protein
MSVIHTTAYSERPRRLGRFFDYEEEFKLDVLVGTPVHASDTIYPLDWHVVRDCLSELEYRHLDV